VIEFSESHISSQTLVWTPSIRIHSIQQNSTYPEAGYPNRELSGWTWSFG